VFTINTSFANNASCFKALSDELRLNILFQLYTKGEKCVCELTDFFEISQSALSYHLRILSESGFLIKRQSAVWNLYSVNKEHFMYSFLKSLFKEKLKSTEIENSLK
jgi:ArsR family transcriptional regulator